VIGLEIEIFFDGEIIWACRIFSGGLVIKSTSALLGIKNVRHFV